MRIPLLDIDRWLQRKNHRKRGDGLISLLLSSTVKLVDKLWVDQRFLRVVVVAMVFHWRRLCCCEALPSRHSVPGLNCDSIWCQRKGILEVTIDTRGYLAHPRDGNPLLSFISSCFVMAFSFSNCTLGSVALYDDFHLPTISLSRFYPLLAQSPSAPSVLVYALSRY